LSGVFIESREFQPWKKRVDEAYELLRIFCVLLNWRTEFVISEKGIHYFDPVDSDNPSIHSSSSVSHIYFWSLLGDPRMQSA